MTLATLLAAGETMTVELKSDVNGTGLVEAIVCLANAQGGTLLVGVHGDGRVQGARPRHRTTTDPRRVEALVSNATRPALGVFAVAVSGDRIDIHSIGRFPTGIRAELLSQEHRSIPRNPLIAGAFHRTGAIEVWGRGTNRVIEACRAYGIVDPTFTEVSGAVTVTFKAAVVAGSADLVPGRHQVGTKWAPSQRQVQLLELAAVPRALPQRCTAEGSGSLPACPGLRLALRLGLLRCAAAVAMRFTSPP